MALKTADLLAKMRLQEQRMEHFGAAAEARSRQLAEAARVRAAKRDRAREQAEVLIRALCGNVCMRWGRGTCCQGATTF